nr:TlpA family protein disulfide reductase [Desulfuromonadales bacterium]
MLTDPDGDSVRLSDLRGRIVLLHFWGSWCAPCQVEFPELQALYDALKDDRRIAFVLVQVREDIARSRRWAEQRGFAMPFHDSGARSPADGVLAMPGGRGIEDRILAPQFPGTYVLDKNGLVLFSHFGPLHSWNAYGALFRHAATHAPE